MRALILRRVALLQGGAAGAVLIGSAGAADVVRLKGFLTRNGYPHHLLDPARDPEAKEVIARYTDVAAGCRSGCVPPRIAAGDLSRRLGARQSIGSGCVTPDRLDGADAIELRLRCRGGWRRTRGPLNRSLWLFRRPDGRGSRRPRLRRSGRRQRSD